MPPLRDIAVGFAFCIGLRGPGRVLGAPPGVRPFLPLYPIDRCPPQLSHSPTFSSSALSPSWSRCDVHPGAGPVCPSRGVVAFAGSSLIPSFHRLVATLVVLRYLARVSAPMWCSGGGRDAAWGFWVSPSASLACCWHLGMRRVLRTMDVGRDDLVVMTDTASEASGRSKNAPGLWLQSRGRRRQRQRIV